MNFGLNFLIRSTYDLRAISLVLKGERISRQVEASTAYEALRMPAEVRSHTSLSPNLNPTRRHIVNKNAHSVGVSVELST